MPEFGFGFVPTKRRPKFTRKGRAYDPAANKREAAAIREAWAEQVGEWKADGPVGVSVDVHRKLPKGRPLKVESESDTFKPDVDNIAKAVLDALNGVAFEDDSQVVCLRCYKHPRRRRDSDRTLVRIWKEEL